MKLVLVVDDNEGDQFLAQHMIEEFDKSIAVECAFDGKEALDRLDAMALPPDAIILDINMPGMDGFEFLEHYNKREHQPAVVVMMSSSEQEKDKERAMQFDAVKAYFSKPVSLEDVAKLAELA